MVQTFKAALAALLLSIPLCMLAMPAAAAGLGQTAGLGKSRSLGLPQQEDARAALTRCMLKDVGQQDQDTMVRWVYIVISLNPAVQGMSKITKKQMDQANADMAALFMRLVSVSCRKEAKRAAKAYPEDPFGPSFNALGQDAGGKLIDSSSSAVMVKGFQQHLDKSKLEQLME